MTMHRVGSGIGVLLLSVSLFGCGNGRPAPQEIAVVVPNPLPDGTAEQVSLPPTDPKKECKPVGSLQPLDPLPAPGRLPHTGAFKRILQRRKLVVGVDQSKNRFGFLRNGKLEGYDIDYAQEIAEAIFGDRTRVQFRALSSAQRILALTGGDVDLVANSMTITCKRQRDVLFSTNYFYSYQRVLVRSNSPYHGIEDLGGHRVCAPASTTSIRNIARYPSHPVPVSVVDWTDCLVLLQQGRVEAISTTDSVLVGLREQDPGTKIVGARFSTEPHGLAMRKSDQDLVRFVNGVLEQMRRNGRWREIYQHWLPDLEDSGNVPPPPPPAVYAPDVYTKALGVDEG
jgi:polar amino acid transport system substrate-binding protein